MNCINGNCEITNSPDYRVIKPMPVPTDEEVEDPFFNELFDLIQGERLTCPEYYEGWQIATGCHVKLIIDQMKEVYDQV